MSSNARAERRRKERQPISIDEMAEIFTRLEEKDPNSKIRTNEFGQDEEMTIVEYGKRIDEKFDLSD